MILLAVVVSAPYRNMQKRLQREEKERCFMLRAPGILTTSREEFLRTAADAFRAAVIPTVAMEWALNGDGRHALRERKDANGAPLPWSDDERADFATLKNEFVETFERLRFEHIEFLNPRSGNWTECVLHQTRIPIDFLEAVRNRTLNPYRSYGLEALVCKPKAMHSGKGKGGGAAQGGAEVGADGANAAGAAGGEGDGGIGNAAGGLAGAAAGGVGVANAAGGIAGAAAVGGGKPNFADLGNMMAQLQVMMNAKGGGRSRSNRRGGKQGGGKQGGGKPGGHGKGK